MSDRCTGFTKLGLRCKRKAGTCRQHGRSGMEGGHIHLQGEGIFSDAKNAIQKRITAIREGPASKPSPKLQKFLDSKKGATVVGLELSQQPVMSPVQKAADLLSLGQYSKIKKKLNYTDVFHNALIVTLSDGTRWKLEKNQTVEHKPLKDSDLKNKRYSIPVTKQLTLDEMIDNASRGQEEKFWKYRADSDNCQKFTRDMVEKNGLLPEETKPLELQDAKALVDTIPGASMIPNTVTDTAAIADRVYQGYGVRGLPLFDEHGNFQKHNLSTWIAKMPDIEALRPRR